MCIQGQWFSAIEGYKVYLLGNPLIWWGNLAIMACFGLVYVLNAYRTKRGAVDEPEVVGM